MRKHKSHFSELVEAARRSRLAKQKCIVEKDESSLASDKTATTTTDGDTSLLAEGETSLTTQADNQETNESDSKPDVDKLLAEGKTSGIQLPSERIGNLLNFLTSHSKSLGHFFFLMFFISYSYFLNAYCHYSSEYGNMLNFAEDILVHVVRTVMTPVLCVTFKCAIYIYIYIYLFIRQLAGWD